MKRGKLSKRKIIDKKDSLANNSKMFYTLSKRLVDDKGKPCVSMGPLNYLRVQSGAPNAVRRQSCRILRNRIAWPPNQKVEL